MKNFAQYWSSKSDSDHTPRKDVDVFKVAAAELSAFHDPAVHRRVLEIGCGAGEVFAHTKFEKAEYLGVDFSSSILAQFSKLHPGVEVQQGEASTFRVAREFDFILVNNVLQHCSPKAVLACLENAVAMLAPNGIVFLGNIPDAAFHFAYNQGHFKSRAPSRVDRLRSGAKYLLKTVFRRPPKGVGYWHQRAKFISWCDSLGLKCEIFGSILYPYRFSCLIRKNELSS